MKKLFQLLAIALTATVIGGCVKEKDMQRDVPMFTITVTGEDVKAGFTPDSDPSVGTLHLAWQAGDQIRVFNHANPAQNAVYTIKDGFTDKTAQFEGPAINADYYDILAPADFEHPDDPAAGNPNLTQNGNGTTDHLTFTAKLENVAKADLADIVFNSNWAADHSATLKKGAIVKFILTLPNAITAPRRVVLEELNSNQLAEDRVSVNIENVSTTSDHVITAYAQAGWEDISLAGRSYVTVGVEDGDGTYYTLRHRLANKVVTFTAGKVNRFQTGSSTIGSSGNDVWIPQLFAGGNGTQGDPYLIANAKHLDNMHVDGILKAEERVYFRLIKDIDMQSYLASNRWIPLNSVNPYDKLVDFDGAGHTISHFSCSYNSSSDNTETQKDPSFFGVLYGACHDVTFADVAITCNDGPCGVLGGYIGYSAKKAQVYNVHIDGGSVTKSGSTGTLGVGGLGGIMIYSYIDSCSSTADVTNGGDFTGGLIGRDSNDASRIRNCWTGGTVYGNQKVGGIIGGLIRTESSVYNCYSVATINAMRFAGCIIGDACLDAGSNSNYTKAATLQPDNVVKGCIAWQSSFATRDQRSPYVDSWGSGAIIGMTALKNYLIDCKRNPSLDTHWAEVNAVTPYDQENANPSTPLVVTNPSPGTMKHYNPYHGKAATSTRLSTVAQSLGWDSSVWDFNGDIPVLTGVVEAEPAGQTPVSGADNVPAGNNLGRAFPGTTSARGTKSATQDGITWECIDVEDGIRYFHAAGTVSASWMDSGSRKQELFVIDYDLSKTDYEVKIVHASPTCVASQVHAATGAIATINGGYESGSIAIKTNINYVWEKQDSSLGNDVLDNIKSEQVIRYESGSPHSFIPNNTIHWEVKNGDTVTSQGEEYNWKSEGAFYCDGAQGVRIAFDGYDGYTGSSIGTNGANAKTKTVQEERLWYRLGTENEKAFISSAPILDANYVRFGMTFKDRHPKVSGEPSEAPYSHQTQACPRTAVAIAYPDDDTHPHLLLIVVDGRYANSAGAYGYSAYWLERHIANAFGPKYMLNLDGGGSSTMCVEGLGDDDTHVVNYPCDNRGGSNTIHNHDGQRARDTFICIVPKI